jgi:hypothetical protein
MSPARAFARARALFMMSRDPSAARARARACVTRGNYGAWMPAPFPDASADLRTVKRDEFTRAPFHDAVRDRA